MTIERVKGVFFFCDGGELALIDIEDTGKLVICRGGTLMHKKIELVSSSDAPCDPADDFCPLCNRPGTNGRVCPDCADRDDIVW